MSTTRWLDRWPSMHRHAIPAAIVMTKETKCLCFQDLVEEHHRNSGENDDNDEGGEDISSVFFELANSPMVSYRLPLNKEADKVRQIQIRQDVNACGQHTGGIVWETAYLLLEYLRSRQEASSLSKSICGKQVIEVGAGCGLLGLGIYGSQFAERVTLTETGNVIPNLSANIDRNYPPKERPDTLRVCTLDWTQCQEDCDKAKIAPHSADTIVGTDVVFSTRFVEPLLETIRYLSHSETTTLLCLQERCKDSHELLLSKAKDYELQVEDISSEVTAIPSCKWGKEMDCCILKMTVNVTRGKKRRKLKD